MNRRVAISTGRSVEKGSARRCCGDQRRAEPGPDPDRGGGGAGGRRARLAGRAAAAQACPAALAGHDPGGAGHLCPAGHRVRAGQALDWGAARHGRAARHGGRSRRLVSDPGQASRRDRGVRRRGGADHRVGDPWPGLDRRRRRDRRGRRIGAAELGQRHRLAGRPPAARLHRAGYRADRRAAAVVAYRGGLPGRGDLGARLDPAQLAAVPARRGAARGRGGVPGPGRRAQGDRD